MLHIWGEVAHFPIISKVRRIYQSSSGLIPLPTLNTVKYNLNSASPPFPLQLPHLCPTPEEDSLQLRGSSCLLPLHLQGGPVPLSEDPEIHDEIDRRKGGCDWVCCVCGQRSVQTRKGRIPSCKRYFILNTFPVVILGLFSGTERLAPLLICHRLPSFLHTYDNFTS